MSKKILICVLTLIILGVFMFEQSVAMEKSEKGRAMWVWHTPPLMVNENQRKEFFDFCINKNIKTIFLQLVISYKKQENGNYIGELSYEDKLRAFLKEATKRKIDVYALDGAPEFALRENHPIPVCIVEAVKRFNNASKEDEIFCGIHFDVEPYLLPVFQTSMRNNLFLQFLEMNKKCSKIAHEAKLIYSVDMPFWMDTDEFTIEFEGKSKPLTFHVIDICDNVGIMAYRNFASGEDGIINCAQKEIEYAESAKKEVYIGVETFKYDTKEVFFVVSIPKYKLEELSHNKNINDMLYARKFKYTKILCLGSENFVHLGIFVPDNASPDEVRFKNLLLEFKKTFSDTYDNNGDTKITLEKEDLLFTLGTNPEYEDYKEDKFETESGNIEYASVKHVMLAKITFFGFNEENFEKEIKLVEKAYKDSDAFLGIAIHYHRSYKDLTNR